MPRTGTAVAKQASAPIAPLAVKRRSDGTYERGQSGNPRGRRFGAKDRVPRGLVRRIVFEVMNDNLAEYMNTLRKAALSPRTVLPFTEAAGRLNKEIGGREDGRGGHVTINLITNVNMLALKAAAPRAAQPIDAGRS